jgi:hypothetical protein
MDDHVTCIASVIILMYTSIPSTALCEISAADRQSVALQCLTPTVRAIVDAASSVSVLPHVR